MNNRKLVRKWQDAIIANAENRLGRPLSVTEAKFIRSRGGFIALELIEESVAGKTGADLEEYLNSESTDLLT